MKLTRMGANVALGLLICLVAASVAWAHGGQLVANQVPVAPAIDGSDDDAVWTAGNHYPLAFNQLNERNQVWTDLENLSASFKLIYSGNVLYGIVYRSDDVTNIGNSAAHENDGVEMFFDFHHEGRSVTQIRSLVGRAFDNPIGGIPIESAWNEEGTILEFAIDVSGVDLELGRGVVIGFNIAINDADAGGRDTQLYPFPGNNTSWNNANSLGHLQFN